MSDKLQFVECRRHEVSPTYVSGWFKHSISGLAVRLTPLTQVVLTSLQGRSTN
jgi:hypothetical protein